MNRLRSVPLKVTVLICLMIFCVGCKFLRLPYCRPKYINMVQMEHEAKGMEKVLIQLEQDYDETTNLEEKRIIRDKIARKMFMFIDYEYNQFLDALVATRKGANFISDVGAIGLDTASVLTKTDSTKSLLAGLSGAVTGARASFNKVYFAEQALPAIIGQMSANRQMILANIEENLFQPVDKYPLRRLVSDLNRYYNAGAIDSALTVIQKQAAEKEEEAVEKLRGQIHKELEKQKYRYEIVLGKVQEEDAFDMFKKRIVAAWNQIEEDHRKHDRLGMIVRHAKKLNIQTEVLKVNGKRDISKLPDFLDTLNYNKPKHRKMVAIIVSLLPQIEIDLSNNELE